MGKEYKEFVAYITEAPTIEISGGVAHVKDRSGATRIERAMSVKNLVKYRDRISRALDRYARGEDNIVIDG